MVCYRLSPSPSPGGCGTDGAARLEFSTCADSTASVQLRSSISRSFRSFLSAYGHWHSDAGPRLSPLHGVSHCPSLPPDTSAVSVLPRAEDCGRSRRRGMEWRNKAAALLPFSSQVADLEPPLC
ncbi:hypothetical protein Q5P01_014097 [Channa striata]|uniref:Uncharacterized protein n=1 Tax=Channa striata TaxID=64152 RepID=A0AA88SIH7_CHASR|nr:hypothetical protein Q5P01_014097 [Channa striata]